jgi:hypothetical protein
LEAEKGHIVGGAFRQILCNVEAYLDAVAAVNALEDGGRSRYSHDKNLDELVVPYHQPERHLGARPCKQQNIGQDVTVRTYKSRRVTREGRVEKGGSRPVRTSN